ncbi:MAG: hypothetical protein IT198_15765 [Acidimicrobiia bacterium]|nr:hypothetical protein [Acidimicrobiia bacterium]
MSPPGEILDGVDKARLKDLLVKNWMTHDAMWFGTAVAELGIETANTLNRQAVRSMAAIEARRLLRVLDMEAVTTLAEMRRFFEGAADLVMGDFMDFEWTWFPETDSVRFEWRSCFAFDGVTMLGVADRYECGIFERIYGWMDTLDVAWEITPDTLGCLMHDTGACVRTMQFRFPPSAGREDLTV